MLCLFRWSLQPETAALYAALTLLPIGFLLGYGGDRLSLRSLVASFVKTGKAGLELLMIGGAAGAIIGVLNISALGFALTSELVGIAGGSLLVLLILAAIVCIVLGMGMPTLGVYILARHAGCAGDHRTRRAGPLGPSVRHVFRHDVDDHAAGRHRRLRGGDAGRRADD